MSSAEIKSEINKTLDRIPEDTLEAVLEFLKKLEQQPGQKLELAQNIRKVLEEDSILLQRLAK